MRLALTVTALLFTLPAWGQTPLPPVDVRSFCAGEPTAEMRDQCAKAQEQNASMVRTMWQQAPETLRRVCATETSYPALGYCLTTGGQKFGK